jgi:hypothetical protein
MAIYHKAAPYTGFDVDTLALLVRLLWAGAMTLSPLVIVLLVVAEFNGTSHDTPQPRKKAPMLNAQKTTLRSLWRGKAQNWRNKRKVRRFMAQPSKNAHNEERHISAQMTENRALQAVFPAPNCSNVVPIKGHNAHTQAVNLNGLKYATQWIKKQVGGRITRAKLGHISKVKSREGVTKIIDALIDNGLLIRLNNGQLYTAHNKAVF